MGSYIQVKWLLSDRVEYETGLLHGVKVAGLYADGHGTISKTRSMLYLNHPARIGTCLGS
jgi:hypothetical protein